MSIPCLFLQTLLIFLLPIQAWCSGFSPGDQETGQRSPAGAPSDVPTPGKNPEPSVYDRIWSHATFFEDRSNPYIHKIALTGRYHGQYAYVHGNSREWDRWDNRRIRLGLRGDFLREFSFNAQVDLSPDSGLLYSGLTDAFFEWYAYKPFRARIGKQMLEYTYEGSISSNEILTTERSLITETVWKTPEYITGSTASFETGSFVYGAGLFGGDQQKEFSRFNAGYGGVLKLGYDFGPRIGLKGALLRADYFYNNGNRGNDAFRNFRHIGSVSLQLQQPQAGINTDLIFGRGLGGQSDVFGLVLIPFYNFTNRLQTVLRYTFALSARHNGLTPLRRYERKVAAGNGDEYHAFYLGLNYYLYGHKLKVMGSLEYTNMQDRAEDGGDFTAWTGIIAVRLSF